MSAPPPPPPPGPPPPPPPASGPPPPPAAMPKGRVDLLADIRKGGKLKKVPESEKKDRSAALVSAPSSSSSSSSCGSSSGGSSVSSGSAISVPMPTSVNPMMAEILKKRANLSSTTPSPRAEPSKPQATPTINFKSQLKPANTTSLSSPSSADKVKPAAKLSSIGSQNSGTQEITSPFSKASSTVSQTSSESTTSAPKSLSSAPRREAPPPPSSPVASEKPTLKAATTTTTNSISSRTPPPPTSPPPPPPPPPSAVEKPTLKAAAAATTTTTSSISSRTPPPPPPPPVASEKPTLKAATTTTTSSISSRTPPAAPSAMEKPVTKVTTTSTVNPYSVTSSPVKSTLSSSSTVHKTSTASYSDKRSPVDNTQKSSFSSVSSSKVTSSPSPQKSVFEPVMPKTEAKPDTTKLNIYVKNMAASFVKPFELYVEDVFVCKETNTIHDKVFTVEVPKSSFHNVKLRIVIKERNIDSVQSFDLSHGAYILLTYETPNDKQIKITQRTNASFGEKQIFSTPSPRATHSAGFTINPVTGEKKYTTSSGSGAARTTSSQPTSAGSKYTVDDLEKLADLRNKGLITEEEFSQLKKQILGV